VDPLEIAWIVTEDWPFKTKRTELLVMLTGEVCFSETLVKKRVTLASEIGTKVVDEEPMSWNSEIFVSFFAIALQGLAGDSHRSLRDVTHLQRSEQIRSDEIENSFPEKDPAGQSVKLVQRFGVGF
jgi:hypothetical protein